MFSTATWRVGERMRIRGGRRVRDKVKEQGVSGSEIEKREKERGRKGERGM
jgi:hypothetical protein